MMRQFSPEDIFMTDENDVDIVFDDRLDCASTSGLGA